MYSGIVLPPFDPVVFQIGSLAVRWYSLAYIVGFILALCLVRQMTRCRMPCLNKALLDDLLFYSVLGVVVGGRLGYVLFYNFSYYAQNFWEIFKVWQGGMAFHGGLLGMIVVTVWFARKHRIPVLILSDILVTVAPIGLLLGRLANFINGELFGRVTNAVPWAMIFPTDPLLLPRHPSQLYEALGEGVFLLLLLNILWWKSKGCQKHPGIITGLFFMVYAALRFGIEYFRAPDAQIGFIYALSLGQWLCLPMLVGGAIILAYGVRRTISKSWEVKVR
ncbi:MAG: prolipoprotein diacylglyceryl transferase [Alphaproteobacteria bacterium]|nr:prolipoprotein diacylglyceryl transferase [Alphaproteobacteria bacterium]